jgi:hypothetical protein
MTSTSGEAWSSAGTGSRDSRTLAPTTVTPAPGRTEPASAGSHGPSVASRPTSSADPVGTSHPGCRVPPTIPMPNSTSPAISTGNRIASTSPTPPVLSRSANQAQGSAVRAAATIGRR